MVSEDTDVSRTRVQRTGEELYAPTYTDLASAPNKEGLMVHVTGGGADPAGYYTYSNSQWSGPSGGPSNLHDSQSDGSGVATNTEIVNYGGYLEASADPNNAKRVTADINLTATDARYLRRVEDSFDAHAPTAPSADPPTTPEPWTFVAGAGSTDVPGGYFYGDTPPSTESARSFGCDFTSTSAPDGSTISSGTWALENEYGVGTGGQTLRISGWAQPTATYSSYDDGTTHSDSETFYGEDDVYVRVIVGNSSLQQISMPSIVDTFSQTASHQAFAGGRTTDLGGEEWVQFTHEATLPADAAYVRVWLQAADRGNSWEIRGSPGTGNAAILLDDVQIDYPSGIRPSGVLSHDHDGVYAGQSEFDSHTRDTTNPHSVSASQAGASPSGHDHSGDSLGDSSPLSSLDTEQVFTTNTNPDNPFEEITTPSGGSADRHVEETIGVGQTATTISSGSNRTFHIVSGRIQGNNDTFIDLLLTRYNVDGSDTVVTIGSNYRGANPTRDYSADGANLELAIGSGTYDVITETFGFSYQ